MHVSFSTSSLASCGSCVYNVSVCVTEHKKREQDLESYSKAQLAHCIKGKFQPFTIPCAGPVTQINSEITDSRIQMQFQKYK